MQNRAPSVLEALQREVYETLCQIGGFRELPLHFGSPSNFEAQLRHRTEMSSGLHLYVHPPIPLRIEEGLEGPLFDELDLCIEVLEHSLSNNSHWSAIAVAEEVCRQLHGFALSPPALQGQLVCRSDRPWDYAFENSLSRLRLHFTATGSLSMPSSS
ncbi:MAG: hypothetical protein LBT57_02805 [Puniceicoccales bacterium]|jgi:hypothetical protein|nr:hypothetical protein [Puniceicoccales bacterium]